MENGATATRRLREAWLIATVLVWMLCPPVAAANDLAALFLPARTDSSPSLLRGSALPSPIEESVTLNLTALAHDKFALRVPGEIFDAMMVSREERPEGMSYAFTIGTAESTSTLTVHAGFVAGALNFPDGSLTLVEGKAFGQAALLRPAMPVASTCSVSPTADQVSLSPNPLPLALAMRQRAVRQLLPPQTIRILHVYVAEAAAAQGGTARMDALVRAATDQLNAIARDSGIDTVTFEVAHSELISFVPTYDARRDLQALAENPVVRSLRRLHAADLVALWTENAANYAYLPTSDGSFNADIGFLMVTRPLILATYALAHEVGHTFGMQHGWGDATLYPSAYGYAHAYHNLSANRQTVLGNAFDEQNFFIQRIPRYSNPFRTLNGVMTGTDTEDNARMLREGAPRVATYHLQLHD